MCPFALDGVKNVTNERTDKAFLGVGYQRIALKINCKPCIVSGGQILVDEDISNPNGDGEISKGINSNGIVG